MNDISEMQRLQVQIDTTRAITESLFKPQPYKSAETYAIEYIQRCDLSQLIPLLTAMIDVVSDELGCATELEDARDVLLESIVEVEA